MPCIIFNKINLSQLHNCAVSTMRHPKTNVAFCAIIRLPAGELVTAQLCICIADTKTYTYHSHNNDCVASRCQGVLIFVVLDVIPQMWLGKQNAVTVELADKRIDVDVSLMGRCATETHLCRIWRENNEGGDDQR